MSYTVNKFDVSYQGKSVPVAIHVVSDGEETSHIVSVDDHENFEIRLDSNQQWVAGNGHGLSEELLGLITSRYGHSKS